MVVLMIWIYFLSYFFVIGMAMNYREEIEETGVFDLKEMLSIGTEDVAAKTAKKDTLKEKLEKKFSKKKKQEEPIPEPVEENQETTKKEKKIKTKKQVKE